MKKLIIFLSIVAIGTSCNDFLKEEQVATLTSEYYNTEQGVEDLIKSAYAPLRWKTGYEWLYGLWNFGTDEYTQSDQLGWKYFNEYGPELNSSEGYFDEFWTNNYAGINRCNVGIERVPNVEGIGVLGSEEGKAIRLAELRFLRGYYYFQLVQQFGSIPLILEPITGVRLEFEKAPVADIYNAIIADFRFAAENLPAAQADHGRATADAARHFAAKAYLTRGSAVEDERGQKGTDMDSVIYYGELAINSSETALLDNYADVWRIDNQENDEIVFAAQFNTELTLLSGSQNRTHLFFLNQYDDEPGMRRVVEYGRPYRRLMPTDYAYDIHDRANDSRLKKSLLTTFFANNEGTIPSWTGQELAYAFHEDFEVVDGDTIVVQGLDTLKQGVKKFAVGDTALLFLINDETTTLTDREIKRMPYTVYTRYYWQTDENGDPEKLVKELSVEERNAVPPYARINTFRPGKAPSLWKYVDPNRASHNDERGTRDVFIARLSETYLMVGEAYGRKGDFPNALFYINEVRKRAGYNEGEQRPATYKFEGDPSETSSTENAMIATEDYFSATDNAFTAAEMYPPSADTKAERFIHFVLNERCRELLGELHRWEDLVRTETLVERAYLFNPHVAAAGTLDEHHTLRPIPQPHLDGIYRDGRPLTTEEKAERQNPGY